MAISNYLQKCEYKLGGLKPHIYLIHKDALTVKIKANGVKVSFNHIKKGKDENDKEIDIIPKIYKIEGALCVYNQEETFASKYRFNSTLEVTINELYKEPFFYGLRTLRTNQYYIIIEDKKGTQYLINPELYTNLNYEYNFTDTTDGQNAVLLTWYNLSNFPLLIFENKVETDTYLLQEQLNYNLGHSFELVMSLHKDINTNDDGVKVTNLYIDSADKIKKIEYLKETFNLNETYDGNMFRVTLSYSIPLDSNQFEWHYNLLEFKDNLYTAVLRTTNDNYIVVGVENGLFPSYNITTSEEDETPNMVNITFTHLSQYPILYTDDITQFRWIPTDEICFGFDKYQLLTQQYSEDWGVTWETTEPEIKKKGEIIEGNSEDCKEYQWIDDGTYCYTSSTQYVKWIATDDFVCENGDKYQKLKKHITVDGETFNPTEEYAKGNLIEKDSQVCQTIAIRWVDINDDYLCFPVNEEYTRYVDTYCDGYNLMGYEEVSNNGILYYKTNDSILIEKNSCDCDYTGLTWTWDGKEYICGSKVDLDATSEYEVWRETNCDNFTGNVDYRNPKQTCKCGYREYEWRISDPIEYVCGSNIINSLKVYRSDELISSKTIIEDLITSTYGSSFTRLKVIGKGELEVKVESIRLDTGNIVSNNKIISQINYDNITSTPIVSGYGTLETTITINEESERLLYIGHTNDNNYSIKLKVTITPISNNQSDIVETSKYIKYYEWAYCPTNDTINEKTDEVKYELYEENCCDCEYREYKYISDGDERYCLNEIDKDNNEIINCVLFYEGIEFESTFTKEEYFIISMGEGDYYYDTNPNIRESELDISLKGDYTTLKTENVKVYFYLSKDSQLAFGTRHSTSRPQWYIDGIYDLNDNEIRYDSLSGSINSAMIPSGHYYFKFFINSFTDENSAIVQAKTTFNDINKLDYKRMQKVAYCPTDENIIEYTNIYKYIEPQDNDKCNE